MLVPSAHNHPRLRLVRTCHPAKARNLNLSIGQTGVKHLPRTAGEQTGANLKVILRAFKELFKLRRHIRSEPGEASVPRGQLVHQTSSAIRAVDGEERSQVRQIHIAVSV